MWWRTPYNPTAYDDDFEDQPSQGPFFKWGLGVALPAAISAYAVWSMIVGRAEFGSNQIPLTLHGVNAITYGVAVLSLALFLHCHYFWGNIYDQAWFAVLGKILAACGFIGGLVVLIVRVGLLGLN